MTFKKKVIDSSKWAILNQIVTQVIRLAVSVYLMRLLAPESFGIFMKVLSIIGISEILVGFRLGGGIVQDQDVSKDQISSVFWITLIGAIFLALIFFLSADLIALLYDDARLTRITQVSSAALVFMGLGYVSRGLLTKKLHFKKIFIANLFGIILSSSIAIWLVWNNYDYWSLVWQWASFNIITSLGFFILDDTKFSLPLRRAAIGSLWSFSNKLLIDDMLNFVARNLDNVLVGKFIGATQLGFYSRAYGLMLLPLQNFVNVIRGVLFPSLSLIQNDDEHVKRVFNSANYAVSFFVQPIFLYTIIYSDQLVHSILGVQWLPIVPLLKVFLILAIVQSHTTLISSVFLSKGRTDIILKISYLSKPVIFAFMIMAVRWGMMPLAITIVTLNIITSIIALSYGLRLINSDLRSYFLLIWPIIKINAVIYGLFYLQHLLYPIESYGLLKLMLILILSLSIYLITFELNKSNSYLTLRNALISSLK